MFAVIGGSGFDSWPLAADCHLQEYDTPYGKASACLCEYQGESLAFMPRHGEGHHVPPHKINYRANIWLLKSWGVDCIAAVNAVGSLKQELSPGVIVLVDDFIDFTWGREHTFYDGSDNKVVHIDSSLIYDQKWRKLILKSASESKINLQDGGVYVCTQGPRFETPAEIRMFATWGGSVVGMTALPEAALAYEAGLRYATIAMVTNLGCGLGSQLRAGEVSEVMAKHNKNIMALLERVAFNYAQEKDWLLEIKNL